MNGIKTYRCVECGKAHLDCNITFLVQRWKENPSIPHEAKPFIGQVPDIITCAGECNEAYQKTHHQRKKKHHED